jgi:hypothetical protein
VGDARAYLKNQKSAGAVEGGILPPGSAPDFPAFLKFQGCSAGLEARLHVRQNA